MASGKNARTRAVEAERYDLKAKASANQHCSGPEPKFSLLPWQTSKDLKTLYSI